MQFIRQMIDKVKKDPELFWYLVVGAATTALNYAVHVFCKLVFNFHYSVNTFIAWAAAVVFAYFANKLLVFRSKTVGTKDTIREAGSFILMRAVSYGMEAALMFLFVGLLKAPELLAKLPINFLVIVANYVFSKLFIFRNKKGETPTATQEENS